MKRTLCLIAVLATAMLAPIAHSQTYPTKQVKIIVPFPPGGSTDIMARVIASRMQTALGQPFVVENRSGAGGVIGTEATAKSAPDGYTVMLASSAPLAVGLKLYPKLPYDVQRDLTPVSMVGEVGMVLVTNPKFQAQTIKDMVAYAKANPGKLSFGLNALGSQSHLLTALFQVRTGTSINMIPYKGSGPAVIDLIGGTINADFENVPAVIEHIKAGRLHAVATLSAKRTDVLPNTPTFAELGMPEFVAAPWFAIVAPAGTPSAIVNKLNAEINKILAAPDVKEIFAKQGANTVIATPEETGAFFRQEIEKWAKVVAETGAKLE
jgi:tripartite-type tricarboxylate transporter receptor subunit TctC